MDLIKYSEWKDTKITLHLLSQILGKIRLEVANQEPQWAHVMLPLTADGFSTGLLYGDDHMFQVEADIRNSAIHVQVDGHKQSMKLENGTPVKAYYDFIFQTLKKLGTPVSIYPKPQEMDIKVPLDQDTEHTAYVQEDALRGLELFHFALREELKFVGPLRCRKVKPGLFWGTFDVSAIIIQNISEPFPMDKVIEKAAFDEQFIEYGFWLGDDKADVPSFFVLPYPFLYKDLNAPSLEPKEAYYDEEVSEYFLDMEAVLASSDTSSHVQRFFNTTFDILSEELKWENCDYYKNPLLMKSQPTLSKADG
ncbi:DUF5996 family protein [Planomicrobium sp. CPCC 101110]|uniref:DUF5996 family protein n=1 Tax=Planomicrobium sp. CPCC 101110 TaxID=2599619 RepID=UPI0011B3AD3E|nr:DUF5996 family protein [Planomicrobium sp. CPCC 101110]TWT25151.1 hypothetical protein FQV30_12310 [Planomicrobium sp. CPCC 101110]